MFHKEASRSIFEANHFRSGPIGEEVEGLRVTLLAFCLLLLHRCYSMACEGPFSTPPTPHSLH